MTVRYIKGEEGWAAKQTIFNDHSESRQLWL